MKKRLILITAGVLALTGAGFNAANAEDVCTDLGCAGTYGDGAYADGAEGNPDPIDGYIFVTSSGGCADDNGSPGNSTNPTCLP